MSVLDGTAVWLLLLGGLHGLNPAMGWLFAVSLGLQERSGRAVWRALPPLAIGHALAVATALLAATLLGTMLSPDRLKWIAAAALLACGIAQLLRHRHPRLGGMRVGARELTAWSFLMASAHGAGLMVVPLLLGEAVDGAAAGHAAHAVHAAHAAPHATGGPFLTAAVDAGLLATALHTAGYLAVAGGLAYVVYARLGLRLLRTAWINLDVIWATALIVTAILTPLL